MKYMKTCCVCDTEFDIEAEGGDHKGEHYCSEHYDDLNTTCPFCEESFIPNETIEEGIFVAMANGNDQLPRGIYKVTRFPCFADGMIEVHYFKNAFVKIRDFEDEEYKRIIDNLGEVDRTICSDCVASKKLDAIDKKT
jgi:hypothetical protein